ncbi:DUF2813 domain-containing protein [Clostridium botulinum]|nr:DUF2813 domain-containing protein [Clostridium botulinum]NFI18156.1 DUF2813 domain-containing protein [Clostridium botulinum]NFL93782.1 DUF2813 domain-containing protein [Clostridium botulinum]NFN51952.1 DUF2813 domain-containing protein [Clostridium botulinum]NFO28281.1 DUF2813 domain-containing protein [Clostridium botulinum]
MKLEKIDINNFRKLFEEVNIDIDFETLVVGKNNTGKTSIFEVVDKFLSGGSSFKFEDFSSHTITSNYINSLLCLYKRKEKLNNKNLTKEQLKELEKLFPTISMNIWISVENDDNLAEIKQLLYEFENNNKIIIKLEYKFESINKCVEEYRDYNYKIAKKNKSEANEINKVSFYEFIKRNFYKFYNIKAYTTKPKSDYLNEVDLSYVRSLFNIGIIAAQREVDDISDQNKQSISNAIWYYYQKIIKENNTISEKDIFNYSTTNITESLNINYKNIFEELIKQIDANFMNDNQQIEIISEFNIEEVLKRNSKLKYYMDELTLPESYNGLGYSNMMYMIVKIITYKHNIINKNSLFNILFIEEPESHLHPQMQSTFLNKINDILGEDNEIYKIITTHSSYILQSADISYIRYFMNYDNKTKVKSLKKFLEKPKYENLKEFIHKYFKINTCDLFFSDKAILVEGTVERMLMPLFIQKYNDEDSKYNIVKQHITTIEVGGAYAHIFNDLLDFLEIKTLIITDIDSVSGSHNSKCECDISSEGNDESKYEIKTSNSCIKDWFGLSGQKVFIKRIFEEYEKSELLIKKDNNKKEIRKIAFQLPVDGRMRWGRTFEEQFIIENADVFSEVFKGNNSAYVQELLRAISVTKANKLNEFEIKNITEDILKDNAYEIVDNIEKTNFSLDLLLYKQWRIPKYIMEGLEWLEK